MVSSSSAKQDIVEKAHVAPGPTWDHPEGQAIKPGVC